MQNIISTIEIALLIMLPLIIYLKQSKSKLSNYIITITVLYSIWYLTYMLFHELSHWLGAWIFNKEVYDYQLIPHFWKGNYGEGFIKYDFQGDYQDFIIILIPYVKDIILCLLGFWILKREWFKSMFWRGFIFLMFLLSPLYDISNNYLAYLSGSMNDFNALAKTSNCMISNIIGVSFMLVSILLTFRTIRLRTVVAYNN